MRLIVKKTPGVYAYASVRNQRTDFPVLACAAANVSGTYRISVGARPGRAICITDEEGFLTDGITEARAKQFAKWVETKIPHTPYRCALLSVNKENRRGAGIDMDIKIKVNGILICESVSPDLLLLDFLRKHGCYSVKRGCETANCGLCTVLLDGTPVLSCSVLCARADGHEVYTLEGLQEEASGFVGFIADQGADQCGFCNPGFVMNTIALLRENPDPSDDEIRAYLAGNLCRCSGYEGQLRGIRNYLDYINRKKQGKE